MKNKWMVLLLAGLLLGMLAGCSRKTAEQENENTEEVLEEVEEADVSEDEEGQEAGIVYEEAELTCTLPAGFSELSDEPGLYVYKTYPTESATISYVISESDYDISTISKEEFEEKLEADYYDAYGDQVDINITQYERINVDGREGLRIMMNYEFKGVVYEQLMFMFYNGEESHILNFTQEQGGKWMEEFEKSGETIAFTN